MFRTLPVQAVIILATLALNACTQTTPNSPQEIEAAQAREEQRKKGVNAVVPVETRAFVNSVLNKDLVMKGDARIGLLYFQDQPAHRAAIIKWLTDNNAKVLFESKQFGYLDATLSWEKLGKLIDTAGQIGESESSFMKLELDSIEIKDTSKEKSPINTPDANTSYIGPVHSAGYGAKIEEFKKRVAADLGIATSDIQGQGTTIAVYDQGIDLSRTDVFGNRMKDFFVGDENIWKTSDQTLQDFMKTTTPPAVVPTGLEDIKDEPSLRIIILDEEAYNADLNGSGETDENKKDKIAVAVYTKNGQPEARFRPIDGLPFGDPLWDMGAAHRAGRPTTINLHTGRYYVREGQSPSPSAVAVKFRQQDSKLSVAFVGLFVKTEHGIANLHMAGGDYSAGEGPNPIKYQGVASKTEFLGMQTWNLETKKANYGQAWIPLSRSIIQAAEAKADVIDLDIFTPGTRNGEDLLSSLLCRITTTTTSVPVIAAHNYGPLQDTIQSLAQSPCALGIGASHSVAALKYARYIGAVDPSLTQDDAVQTAGYSGRGFGMNGLLKPDIIAPAYGYTAYGKTFIRFAGTSGATPTTAGAIALLKQAARLKNVELGFDQIKFLLQGSSMPVRNNLLRDGYGFLDLEAAWNLFKENLNTPSFALSGHTRLGFDGQPQQRVIRLDLKRTAINTGSGTVARGPEHMNLWIEYGGASAGTKTSWLKFYDLSKGTATTTLSFDAPMAGESERLVLYLDLPPEVWNELPKGDHIAVVKGVRTQLKSGRNVDFLLPVSFTKGEAIDESTIQIKPLYADQYQIVSIATNPGDHLWIYGNPQCLGTPLDNADRGTTSSPLNLLIDNESNYPHAESMMNGYNPMMLSPSPIRTIAEKHIVRLALLRNNLFKCDGAFGGSLIVRRMSFAAENGDTTYLKKDGKLSISASSKLTLNGSGITEAGDLDHGTAWMVKADEATLNLRHTGKGPLYIKAPKNVLSVRVMPTKNSEAHFQGILYNVMADESTTKVTSDGPFHAGMRSQNQKVNGEYSGLMIESPPEGSTVQFLPASGETEAIFEIKLKLPEGMTSKVLSFTRQSSIKSWLRGETKTIDISVEIASQASGSSSGIFNEFPDSEWSYTLDLPIKIVESMRNARPDSEVPPMTLWQTSVQIPLPRN